MIDKNCMTVFILLVLYQVYYENSAGQKINVRNSEEICCSSSPIQNTSMYVTTKAHYLLLNIDHVILQYLRHFLIICTEKHLV